MKTDDAPKAYARIDFGYDSKMIMPIENVAQLLLCLSSAELIKDKWDDNKQTMVLTGKPPDVTVKLVSGTEWLNAKMEVQNEN